jgi:hypothetical protein
VDVDRLGPSAWHRHVGADQPVGGASGIH